MEIVVQILKHLPAGWPRIIAVLGLAVLFFFPEMRRLVTRGFRDKERYGRVKELLDVRRLELTVVDLKAKHPEAQNQSLDSRIEALLKEPEQQFKEKPSIAWKERFAYATAGAFALAVMGTIAIWHSGRLSEEDVGKFILTELGLTVLCGLLASAIPCKYRWECAFRGFLIPALLGALAVAAKGNV